MIYDKTVVITN